MYYEEIENNLGLIVLAILASNTACSSKNSDKLMESSAVTNETMASTSIMETTAPTETTEETSEETIEVTPEPTESMSELEKSINYLRDLHSVHIKYSTYYLKMDQEVHLRDVQAADGILSEDLEQQLFLAERC